MSDRLNVANAVTLASASSASASPTSLPADDPGYRCAICGTNVPARTEAAAAHRYRPFCSARCQRIDLGNWLDERYVVPGAPAAQESSTAAAEPDEP